MSDKETNCQQIINRIEADEKLKRQINEVSNGQIVFFIKHSRLHLRRIQDDGILDNNN